MLNRIRNALNSEEHAKSLTKKLTEQNQKINNLGKEVASLRASIADVAKQTRKTNEEQKKALADFKKAIDAINKDGKMLHGSITEFSIQKSNAAAKIVEQLRTDISDFTNVLRTDVHSFNKLKSEVDSIRIEIERMRAEITRFTDISKKLRSSDFEMTRYIRKVQDMDNDKLSLLKKIDTLERMIGKQRRNQ